MLQNANVTTPNVAALLHTGNIITAIIQGVFSSEDPCDDRVSNVLKFGYIEIDEDLISGPYNNKIQTGDYVMVYKTSDLVEQLFRIRMVESGDPTGTVIHLIETDDSDLGSISVNDVIVLGLNVEESASEICASPKALRAIRLRPTSAHLEFSYVSSIEVYRIRYKRKDSNAWLYQDIIGSNYYADITGLVSNVWYEWQVMGFCEYPLKYSKYSESVLFKTRQ